MAGGAGDCYYFIDYFKRHLSHLLPQEIKKEAPASSKNSSRNLSVSDIARLFSEGLYERVGSGEDDEGGLSVGTMISGFQNLPYYSASPSDEYYNPPDCNPPYKQLAHTRNKLFLTPLIFYVDSSGNCERVLKTAVGSGQTIASALLDTLVSEANQKYAAAINSKCVNDPLYRLYRTNVAVTATDDEAISMIFKAVRCSTQLDNYSGGIIQVYQIKQDGRGGGKWRRVIVKDVNDANDVNDVNDVNDAAN
jgi:20S proteasome alpha/beta subunit